MRQAGIGAELTHDEATIISGALELTEKYFKVKEEAQQLALISETVGAFEVKRRGGKGKQIFGSIVFMLCNMGDSPDLDPIAAFHGKEKRNGVWCFFHCVL